MSHTVLVEKTDGVVTVTMNRPDKLNSLTTELLEALSGNLKELAYDSSTRVVVLTGAGERGFPAGADPRRATGPARPTAISARHSRSHSTG